MRKLFLALTCTLFMACGSKKATLESVDTKTATHIHILAERESSLDPFQVNIQVEGNGLKESIGTEIFAGQLDSTNVHFDWREPGVCLITFMQQDNTKRKILAVALPERIGLKEMESE
jgi:hypothetical protein